MQLYEAIVIILLIILIFVILFFPDSIKMRGNGTTSILFIGTVPIIQRNPDLMDEKTIVIDGAKCLNADYYQKNNSRCNGASRMRDINEFIKKHEDEITYNFLINRENLQMGGSIDPRYEDAIIDFDLRNGLPPNIGQYNIVYIDTNTLQFIGDKTQEQWIDFFKPLMADNGCMIIDDTDCFEIGRDTSRRVGPWSNRIYNGLSVKNYLPTPEMQARMHNKVLLDFINMVVRFPEFPLLFIPIPPNEENIRLYKIRWDLK